MRQSHVHDGGRVMSKPAPGMPWLCDFQKVWVVNNKTMTDARQDLPSCTFLTLLAPCSERCRWERCAQAAARRRQGVQAAAAVRHGAAGAVAAPEHLLGRLLPGPPARPRQPGARALGEGAHGRSSLEVTPLRALPAPGGVRRGMRTHWSRQHGHASTARPHCKPGYLCSVVVHSRVPAHAVPHLELE